MRIHIVAVRSIIAATAVIGAALVASAVAGRALGQEPRVGSEIADLTQVGADRRGPTDILIDGPPNPISPEEFRAYVPPPGYVKNTPRSAQFNAQETLSSPDRPAGEVTNVTTPDGYTWILIARTRSFMWPFRAEQYAHLDTRPTNGWEAAFATPTPPEGVVRYSDNGKNQIMYFWARENESAGPPIRRYFIRDRWGNRYMMMASGGSTPEETRAAFEAAVLPRGWTKSSGFLPRTRAVVPAYGHRNIAHFNVWRDSADNSWVQIGWSKSGRGIAQKIGDGMPIWGSHLRDRLRGTNGDDVIHGAERNDTIVPRKGDDAVFGDGGRRNTAVLRGKAQSYRVVARRPSSLTLVGDGDRKLLHSIQRIRFANRTCATSVIRANARRSARQSPRVSCAHR